MMFVFPNPEKFNIKSMGSGEVNGRDRINGRE